LGPAPKDGALDWSRRRLDRILVDHLLRTGNYDSALQLASESGIQVRPSPRHAQLQRRGGIASGASAHQCWYNRSITNKSMARMSIAFAHIHSEEPTPGRLLEVTPRDDSTSTGRRVFT